MDDEQRPLALWKAGTTTEFGVVWTVYRDEEGRLWAYDDPSEPAGSLALVFRLDDVPSDFGGGS